MKRRPLAALTLAILTGSGLAIGGAVGPASATDIYTNCITSSGTSYLWTSNKASKCPGWLDVYDSGKKIAHVNEALMAEKKYRAKIARDKLGAAKGYCAAQITTTLLSVDVPVGLAGKALAKALIKVGAGTLAGLAWADVDCVKVLTTPSR